MITYQNTKNGIAENRIKMQFSKDQRKAGETLGDSDKGGNDA